MKTWSVSADEESAAWRDRIAKAFPLVSDHKIVRLCMKYGLRSAVLDPTILIEEAAGETAPEKVEVQP